MKKLSLLIICISIVLSGCASFGLNKIGSNKVADDKNRTATFFKKHFDDGKYLLKFRSWEETGQDMTCIMGVDGENYYLEYETNEGKQILFVKDNKSYGIFEDLKAYVVEDIDENAKMEEDFNSKDIIGKTYEVCQEKIGDYTYECEKFTDDSGEESHYCFDNDELKYIVTKIDDKQVFLEFISVSDDISDDYFKVPDGYEKIEY